MIQIKAWALATACAAALATGLAAGWTVNDWRLSGQLEAARTAHAHTLAAHQAASTDVISRTLLRERDLRRQYEELEQNAQAEKQNLERRLADSNAAARGMRERLDRLSRRITADTGTTAECQPARAAVAVLADVLVRFDEAAGEYAALADGSRIAGVMCERLYDAAVEQSKGD